MYPKEVIQSNSKIKCDSVSVYTEQKVSVDIRVTMINIELKNIQLYKCHPLLWSSHNISKFVVILLESASILS